MSGLKNSPFGKRLRASHQDTDDDAPRRNRPRINPIFGVGSSTPSLDSSRPTTGTSDSGGPESPTIEQPRFTARDYGDRFVPSRDAGDMRTSYHLMDEGGPSTPSKNRIIPSESDALKGMPVVRLIVLMTDICDRRSQCHLHIHPSRRSDSPIPSPTRITNTSTTYCLGRRCRPSVHTQPPSPLCIQFSVNLQPSYPHSSLRHNHG